MSDWIGRSGDSPRGKDASKSPRDENASSFWDADGRQSGHTSLSTTNDDNEPKQVTFRQSQADNALSAFPLVDVLNQSDDSILRGSGLGTGKHSKN